MWRAHAMVENYSALEGRGILQQATTWMNLEDVMQVEQARHKRSNTVWFHLYELPREVKSIETESRIVVVKGQGQEEWGVII